jgi:CPA2 family monovalent cation:H+ antiporter-2
MSQTLQLILVLLGAAVFVVVICRLVRLPPILGYLLVGIALGPNAFGWVAATDEERHLAEFGIVFLMFSIGLEFSLPQLRSMRRAVFGFGFAQVAITTIGAMFAMYLLGYGLAGGFALGGALAMSSTAIVSKMLAERMELATPHGRDVMGILLFQDLAVVAFLIVLPSLSKGGGDLAIALAIAALKAAAALSSSSTPDRPDARVVHAGRAPTKLRALRAERAADHARARALTELAGLSLALGAFLAGC